MLRVVYDVGPVRDIGREMSDRRVIWCKLKIVGG